MIRQLRRFFIAVIILLSFTLNPIKTYACSPAGASPWFNTSLTFDKRKLPPGVEIVQTDPTYEPYSIINRNMEPFYIVKRVTTDWETFPNTELPRIYKPKYKLIDSKSFYYSNDTFSEPPESGYKQNSGGINNSAASRAEINDRIYSLDGK